MRVLINGVAFIDPGSGDPDSVRIVEHGHLIFDGGRISAAAAGECAQPRASFAQVVDGRGKLAIPGWVNTHGHAAMSLLRGYADDLPLQEWLSNRIWPAEDRLTGDDVRWGTRLALLEMIETGTTTFTDMYYFMDGVAEAAIESGIRAVLSRGLVGFGPEADSRLAEGVALAREFHMAEEGRIRVMLGPHAPYTCPPDYLKKVIAASEREDLEIQIHISETAREVADCLAEYGKTPGELLESTGLFERPVLAAHCVHLTESEIALFARRGVHIAHNPGSNLKLGSGIAPLPAFLQHGIPTGLGTDGAASNNKLDMWEEVRLAALLHKGMLQKATEIPAQTALYLGSSGGAKALFLDPSAGRLEPGSPADVQLLDITGPRYHPPHNLLSHAIYSSHAGDVTDVFVAGRALYRNREFQTIDRERVLFECDRIGDRLRGRENKAQ